MINVNVEKSNGFFISHEDVSDRKINLLENYAFINCKFLFFQIPKKLLINL